MVLVRGKRDGKIGVMRRLWDRRQKTRGWWVYFMRRWDYEEEKEDEKREKKVDEKISWGNDMIKRWILLFSWLVTFSNFCYFGIVLTDFNCRGSNFNLTSFSIVIFLTDKTLFFII